MIYYDTFDSPLGSILICANETGITQINLQDGANRTSIDPEWVHSPEKMKEAVDQLKAYFKGERRYFQLPLAPEGTEFQQKVWKALQEIPFGEVRNYQEIATQMGNPNACRAVGLANSLNPVAIVIPCHRVIGKNGKLTGYAGGLRIKEKLLIHEGILAPTLSLDF